MIEWIFTFLALYLLYKLIFDFIIPVSRATSQVRSKINEMNHQQGQQQQPVNQQQPRKTTSSHPSSEDYIDFEEIK
jgi:hypothetical protein